jgi:hypothetical protein
MQSILKKGKSCFILFIIGFAFNIANAQNPIIYNQFTADPSARVFGDKVYVYPSHDIVVQPGHGRPGWFCMEDYHVFSSSNLTHWTDHGVIVSQDKVPWGNPEGYSMWAPDCIFRNGKYYFYFPDGVKDTSNGRGFAIGVAVSDKPYGPFKLQPQPIKNVHGIDPNVFIDKDGQAYLYWAQGSIYGAKLKENMLELASEPKVLGTLPDKGLKEGPYLFERNGIYYLTYPHVEDKTEQLEYAISRKPLGPFTFAGIIMDESPECWTNHQSLIEFKNQWYLFYHHNDLSPNFDKNRSVRIDSLFFKADGTIKKVIPTLRGVGLTDATKNIQIDRYSLKSAEGVSIDFLDTTNRFLGWKTAFNEPKAWVQYNSVDFGKTPLKTVTVKFISGAGATMELRANSINGPVLSEIKVPKSGQWSISRAEVLKFEPGVHNIFVMLKSGGWVEVDWLSFE